MEREFHGGMYGKGMYNMGRGGSTVGRVWRMRDGCIKQACLDAWKGGLEGLKEL